MNAGWIELGVCLAASLVLAPPLGVWIARVLEGDTGRAGRWLRPLENGIHRLCGIRPDEEMVWPRYALALVGFHGAGLALLYALQRLQGLLPLNPAGFGPVEPDLALNTAVSFVTNTNWQAYGGENSLSPLVQAAGLGVQNFLSAVVGLAVAAALARGFLRSGSPGLGNLWADLVRATLYVLLPGSLLLSAVLLSQGVPQEWGGPRLVEGLQAVAEARGDGATAIPVGPVASQVAIKQLGSNGGGFYNANSAHPLENPTPVSHAAELLGILVPPLACLFAFGRWMRNRAQGWTLAGAVLLVLLPLVWLGTRWEGRPNPAFAHLGLDERAGLMEGREVRFGAASSAAWALATTATSNGSVEAMHSSFSPMGGMAQMVLMQVGEVAPGGVGSGLYGLLGFAVVAVFLAGLMVGRTPELFGKRLGSYEIRMASLMILLPSLALLAGTALACLAPAGRAAAANPGPHGFSELLYAFTSAANNNGSAFAGLAADSLLFNLSLAACMMVGRLGVIIPALAMAGSLARARHVPATEGTLPTTGPLFAVLLAGTILLVGALTFLPALSLGPIAEFLAWK